MSNSIKLLALDASSDLCSVSLYLEGKVLNRQQLLPRAHARLLLPMVESFLNEADLTLQDLDVLACGRGPGSFTGIRIACSMVQSFGFGLRKPIVLVSTLRAMAAGAYRQQNLKQVLVTLNATQQDVYWGLFELDNNGVMQPVSTEKVEPKEQIVLPPGNWKPYSEYPEAQDVAHIAAVEYKLGHTIFAEKVEPVYLKTEFVKKMAT